jgi:hypothetical protein
MSTFSSKPTTILARPRTPVSASPRYQMIPSVPKPTNIPDEFLSQGECLKKAILMEMNKPYTLIMKGYFIMNDFCRIQRFCDLYQDSIDKTRQVLMKFVGDGLREILRYYNQETMSLYETHLLAWYQTFKEMLVREEWSLYKIVYQAEIELSKGLLKIFEDHHRTRLNLSTQDFKSDNFYKKICNVSVLFKKVNEKYLLRENLRLLSEMHIHMDHVVIQYSPMLNFDDPPEFKW